MAINLTGTTFNDIWQNGVQNMDCGQIQKDLMSMVIQFTRDADLEYECLADKWPMPSVLICRPSAQTFKKASKFLASTYVLSSCEKATKTLLQTGGKDTFQHDRLFVFFTDFQVFPLMDDISPSYGFSVADPYREVAIYKLNRDRIIWNNSKLPDAYTLSDVIVENARLITDKWEMGKVDGSSLMYIEYVIRHCLSVGIKDETGKLVAWSLQHPWGPLGVIHVVEEHRKRGLGSFVLLAIADKISQKNGYALSEVPLDNELSVKLHEKCGFKLISQGHHKIIDPILVIDKS